MPEKMRIRSEGLADNGALGRGDLVEAAHGCRVGGAACDLWILGCLLEDRGDRIGEGVESLLRLGLRRLDHQGLFDQEGEIDGGGMKTEVEQALGEVERLNLQGLLHRAAR